MNFEEFSQSRARRTLTAGGRMLRALGLDGPLTGLLALIVCMGVIVVYSASGQNVKMVEHHLANIAIAIATMLALARLATPQYLRMLAPVAYAIGVVLLIVVAITGHVGKGAQRWLDVGFMRFQPSEIMKLAVPMVCAWYMHERPLPPTFRDLVVMGLLIAVPTMMIVMQPDLGTALLIAASGLMVMLLAGMSVNYLSKVLAGLDSLTNGHAGDYFDAVDTHLFGVADQVTAMSGHLPYDSCRDIFAQMNSLLNTYHAAGKPIFVLETSSYDGTPQPPPPNPSFPTRNQEQQDDTMQHGGFLPESTE